jgi:hypothetical protein
MESPTAPPATSPSNRAASCRCTDQADRAGRADRIASRRPASRARERAESMVNAPTPLLRRRAGAANRIPKIEIGGARLRLARGKRPNER